MPENDLLFDISTPLKFRVRGTHSYWQLIVTVKHPIMNGREKRVQEVLENPDVIKLSQQDNQVYLFYKRENPQRWICAVTKRLNGDGFLITTYPTDAIKEGKQIWQK
jgi:hypothetical protein